eukprot:12029950-Prorocentrum_lima.AAC.1
MCIRDRAPHRVSRLRAEATEASGYAYERNPGAAGAPERASSRVDHTTGARAATPTGVQTRPGQRSRRQNP